MATLNCRYTRYFAHLQTASTLFHTPNGSNRPAFASNVAQLHSNRALYLAKTHVSHRIYTAGINAPLSVKLCSKRSEVHDVSKRHSFACSCMSKHTPVTVSMPHKPRSVEHSQDYDVGQVSAYLQCMQCVRTSCPLGRTSEACRFLDHVLLRKDSGLLCVATQSHDRGQEQRITKPHGCLCQVLRLYVYLCSPVQSVTTSSLGSEHRYNKLNRLQRSPQAVGLETDRKL